MKKSVKLTALLALILVVLTGCVTVDYEVKVNSDGSGTVSYVYAFEKSFLESMGVTAEDMVVDMKENAELSDYTVIPYSDTNFEGFKATKELDDITEFSLEEAFGVEYIEDTPENRLQIKTSKGETIYSQEAEIDLTSLEDMSMYGIVLEYTITLPVKVGDNNADEVSSDGKTLTWSLEAGGINEISFEASSKGSSGSTNKVTDEDDEDVDEETGKKDSDDEEDDETFVEKLEDIFGDNALLIVGIGGGVLLLLLVIIIVLIATRKGKKSKTAAPVTPVVEKPVEQPPVSTAQEEVKEEIKEEAKPEEEIKSATKCSECGAEVAETDSFCPGCGNKLK